MKLISFLLQCSTKIPHSRSIVVLVIVTGVIGGICNTALLAIINATLTSSSVSKTALAWSFAVVCILLPVTRFASEVLLARLSAGAAYDLRMYLGKRILSTPLRRLEELGAPRLLAALTNDIPVITNTFSSIPILCMHITIVVGCLVYLGYLSKVLLLVILACMALGIVTYQLPITKGGQYFKLVRENWDSLLKHFQGVINGTKELKLHRKRRDAFVSQALEPTASALRKHSVAGHTIFSAANSWGQVLIFIVIGIMLFIVPMYRAVTPEMLTGYALSILYLMTPFQVILNTMPTFNQASVAMHKIQEIGFSLAQEGEHSPALPIETPLTWNRLDLVGVTHAYRREKEDSHFTLGPIDLSFFPRELVFLIGGNGSGKTTLAKLLVGLYSPEAGEIHLDGQPITGERKELLREHFSVIFADFFLFENLHGLEAPGLDTRAADYLARLHIDHAVQVQDGVLSTVELSAGQRKRLALVIAYLEDRPIYVFDEWAADQDPEFKDVFYYQLLPELKARGKTVFVISHDDRYYHVADRIIKLDYGRVEFDRPVSSIEKAPSMASPVAR
jgi:putative ATP-binding cassette transporter